MIFGGSMAFADLLVARSIAAANVSELTEAVTLSFGWIKGAASIAARILRLIGKPSLQ
jgi:hypothetical protein